jgi:hypothetical protein
LRISLTNGDDKNPYLYTTVCMLSNLEISLFIDKGDVSLLGLSEKISGGLKWSSEILSGL